MKSIITSPLKIFISPIHYIYKKVKRLNKKLLTTYLLGFIAFAAIAGIYLFNLEGNVDAAWFNDSWSYRQRIDITNSGSAQTDYQISFSWNTSALVTAGKMQSDCDDIRITDVNGKILPHWIEKQSSSACNTTTTKIWTKVPSISTTGDTLYVYYGNESATSTESGQNTFLFFDDFSVSSAVWAITGAQVAISSGKLNFTTGTSAWNQMAYLGYTFPRGDTTLEFDYQWTSNAASHDAFMMGWKDSGSGTTYSDLVYAFYNPGLNADGTTNCTTCPMHIYEDGTLTAISVGTWTRNTNYKNRVRMRNSGGAYFDQSTDGGNSFTTAYTSSISTESNLRPGFSFYSGDHNIDNLFVRKDAATPPTAAAPTSEEKAVSPSLFWKFDDGQGTTAQDSTANNLDGTVSTVTWQPADRCVFGMCLLSAGSGGVTRSTSDTVLAPGTGSFSVSAWVKHNSITPSGNQAIVQRLYNALDNGVAGYVLYMNTSGNLCFGIDDDATHNSLDDSACTSETYLDSSWHYVTAVKSGTSSITIFVDTVQKAQDSSITSATLSGSGALFNVGAATADFNGWTGFIDEIKVYNGVALSTDQIKVNYNARGNPEGVATVLGTNTENNPNLTDGLVGYWKMDENTGTSTADVSGSGGTGTLSGTTWAAGKFGSSTSYDGTNDYVQVAHNAALNVASTGWTVSGWFYDTESSFNHDVRYIMAKGTASGGENFPFAVRVEWHELIVAIGNNFNRPYVCYNLTAGGHSVSTWVHYAATYNPSTRQVDIYINGNKVALTNSAGDCQTSGIMPQAAVNNSDPLYIGQGGGSAYWRGRLDEQRIYNRILGADEIKQLYRFAPGPVGYWNMEQASWNGTSGEVKDISGNGNNGTASGATLGLGKYGKGGSFDGTDDRVRVADNNALDLVTGTMEVWIRKTEDGQWASPISKGDSENATNYSILFNTSDVPLVIIGNGSSISVYDFSNIDLSSSNYGNQFLWHHLAVTWDGSNVRAYLNGALVQTLAQTTASAANTGQLRIGEYSDSNDYFQGDIDEVRIYNYPRTAAQIVEDMNAGHPAPGSPVGTPVGHWKFNEGADNMCSGGTNDICNSGNAGSTFDGTSTATRTNSGKFGRALDYNGTTSLSTVTNGNAIDFQGGLTNFTFSAWVNADSDGESDVGRIFDKTNSHYFRVDSESGGLDVECNLDRTTDNNVNVANAFATGTWAYVACTYDGTTMKVYVNGQERGSSSSGSGTIAADGNLTIGNNSGGSATFDGRIDEFKIYNTALTASQIALDMNNGSFQVLGAMGNNSTAGAESAGSQEYCVPGDTATCTGPILRLDLEEGSGTTARDISGNANNGTITGAFYNTGKVGKSLVFDGTNDDVSIADSTSLDSITGDFTIDLWIKPGSTQNSYATILSKHGSGAFTLEQNNNTTNQYYLVWDTTGSGGWTGSSALTTLTAAVWQKFTIVKSGTALTHYVNGVQTATTTGSSATVSTNNQALKLGDWSSSGGRDWSGEMDQVRIYNYARTPAQVAWDYNRGGPVAHWKMDECQGTTINDSTGNSLTGTLTNATAGTCTTSGSWFGGVSGKRNYSLDFDGSDDIISVSDNDKISIDSGLSQGFTFATWVYPHSDGESDTGEIFDKGTNTFCRTGSESSGRVTITCRVDLATDADFSATTTIPINQWSHVAFSWTNDGDDEVTIWINGAPQTSSAAFAGDGAADANSLTIGGTPNFDGLIDDFRIYNYELTGTQVKTLLNEGAARFAPVTGAP